MVLIDVLVCSGIFLAIINIDPVQALTEHLINNDGMQCLIKTPQKKRKKKIGVKNFLSKRFNYLNYHLNFLMV